VVPGKYELRVWTSGVVPGAFEKPGPFEVVSGKATTVAAKFGPAAKVTGKITDKDGKGLAKVPVQVHVSDGPGPVRESFHVETDAEGNFTAYGSAGFYSLWISPAPEGYALPQMSPLRGNLVEPAKVEVGKSHTFAPVALLTAVTFSGKVVMADGKPAAGATVDVGRWGFA